MVMIYHCRKTRRCGSEISFWLILGHSLSLGNLIHHDAHRYPSDAVYAVETIGM